jgi:hypothetical protein
MELKDDRGMKTTTWKRSFEGYLEEGAVSDTHGETVTSEVRYC